MDGRVDNTHDAAFTHTVRLTDPDRAVEVTAVCTPSPAYEVQEASARVLAGAVDPGIAADFPRPRRHADGRRVHPAAGRAVRTREGAGLFVDAGDRGGPAGPDRSTKMPRRGGGLARAGDANECWALDMAGLGGPSRLLLHLQPRRPRALRHAAGLLSDGAGALQPAARGARGLHPEEGGAPGPDRTAGCTCSTPCTTTCTASTCTTRWTSTGARSWRSTPSPRGCPTPGSARSRRAGSRPCAGRPVDAALRKGIQAMLGGTAGCAQLFDLTSDLLKLLTLPATS